MNLPILTSVIFLVLIIFLLLRYVNLFVQFMLNEVPVWDKNIEKPRLLIYIIMGPLSYIMIRWIQDGDGFWNLLFGTFIFATSCFIIVLCWNNNLILKIRYLIAPAISKNSCFIWKPIVLSDEQIVSLYNDFVRKDDAVFKGELSSFRNFVLNRPLGVFAKRMNFVYTGKSTRKDLGTNQNALIGFVLSFNSMNLDDVLCRQVNLTEYTKELENLINQYFKLGSKETVTLSTVIWENPKLESILYYKEVVGKALKNNGMK